MTPKNGTACLTFTPVTVAAGHYSPRKHAGLIVATKVVATKANLQKIATSYVDYCHFESHKERYNSITRPPPSFATGAAEFADSAQPPSITPAHVLARGAQAACLYAMILRASPSGSSTMRHSLSQIIVLLVSGSVGSHFKPGRLGFPVAVNAAHEEAMFFASACASSVLPVPCSQRLVLSKQN